MGFLKNITIAISVSTIAPLAAIADVTDISVGAGGVALDDAGPGLGASTIIRNRFDVLGTLEISATGDIVISTGNTGNSVDKANASVEAIFGMHNDMNIRDGSLRMMRGFAIRGRFERDPTVALKNSTFVGVGYARDVDIERTLGYSIRAMIEGGQSANANDKYFVVQARGEGGGFICKSLDRDDRHAVCGTLATALAGGYKQASADGRFGAEYRRRIPDSPRIFLNEVRVGAYVGGTLRLDSDDFNSGGQVGVGVEFR